MPYPPPPRIPSGPRRRALLASAAGAALLAGCSSGSGGSDSAESAGGSPSLAERARARAARDSQGIVARYDAVLAAYPTLAERLAPLREAAVRHAEAFGGTVTAGSSASASPTAPQASPSASPTASQASPSATAPTSEKDALAGLATAERTLADARAKALLEVPGELARLLASAAAAGAAHAYLLTEGAK
ncbi:hypothetical protein DI272_13735 [Streptomyces sp. Act143]|uniref:hypothetical protein n=1 Tax=Streptomyces sp. Act143 TaxID=2200760 RepID=UPI000D675F5B|nr:hypothetical protein [Streptomyces sp. Act143]PWI15109.1 hypothetical protein DI272_13735 [Streptomyces sp. Act143]